MQRRGQKHLLLRFVGATAHAHPAFKGNLALSRTYLLPSRLLELVEPPAGGVAVAADDEAVVLQQSRLSDVLVGFPPEARAGRRAAGAQGGPVKVVQLVAFDEGLQPLALRRRGTSSPFLYQIKDGT